MRMNQIDYSHSRMCEAVEKIGRIGGVTQETFNKSDFVPLKLDYDAYSIRIKYEDEEKEKEEILRREKLKIIEKKSSGELFKEKLFTKNNMK